MSSYKAIENNIYKLLEQAYGKNIELRQVKEIIQDVDDKRNKKFKDSIIELYNVSPLQLDLGEEFDPSSYKMVSQNFTVDKLIRSIANALNNKPIEVAPEFKASSVPGSVIQKSKKPWSPTATGEGGPREALTPEEYDELLQDFKSR